MKVSSCCGVSAEDAEELGLCPKCLEHCEFSCEHEWEHIDDSFDHEFGTERIQPYERCLDCEETREVPERDYEESFD